MSPGLCEGAWSLLYHWSLQQLDQETAEAEAMSSGTSKCQVHIHSFDKKLFYICYLPGKAIRDGYSGVSKMTISSLRKFIVSGL